MYLAGKAHMFFFIAENCAEFVQPANTVFASGAIAPSSTNIWASTTLQPALGYEWPDGESAGGTGQSSYSCHHTMLYPDIIAGRWYFENSATSVSRISHLPPPSL